MAIEKNIGNNAAKIYCLEEINRLPLALDSPRFRHYPAMKLGCLNAIDFFSAQLCALATDIMSHESNHGTWVLTAPAHYHLPAAANLLARKVHHLFQERKILTELIEPRLAREQIEIRTQDELNNYYNYSKNDRQQRVIERQRVQQTTNTDTLSRQLHGKPLLIINDIYVTGTQQQFMQRRFNELGSGPCYWLYIFYIDTLLVQDHPDIEFQINNSRLQDLDEFVALLAHPNTRHTARCIGRLFNESLDNFSYLIAKLDNPSREKLKQLALQEGRYTSELFLEKMQLLSVSNTESIYLSA